MSGWLEAYERLPEAQKVRVQRWIHLQKFIAETLGMPFEQWVETYVGAAMQAPFDYSFMEAATISGFAGLDADGATFTKDLDPATARVARVPLRAKNQLGRLSSGLQDALARLLEDPEATAPVPIPPADVVTLQKILPGEKGLARLKRKDFRKARVVREGPRVRVVLEGDAAPLVDQDVFELSAVLNKPLL
jgi:hypothetical protein